MRRLKGRGFIAALILLFTGGGALFILPGCDYGLDGAPYTTTVYSDPLEIKQAARRAAVDIVIRMPIMRVSFTTPLEDEDPVVTEDSLDKALEDQEERYKEEMAEIDDRIDEAIRDERDYQARPRYEDNLTAIDEWGHTPVSRTFVALGAFAPDDVKFPQRVLVAVKTEETEISPWDKEYEEDVMAISETANVSPSKAKDILSRIKAEGYSITKEEVVAAQETELLWFRNGWDTTYPRRLDWRVTVVGEDTNLIKGYDPRGILEIRFVADDAELRIKAGYLDLRDEFKEKGTALKLLEKQKKELEGRLDDAREMLEEQSDELLRLKNPVEDEKRDITEATGYDIKYGRVKVEVFWALMTGSGVYLGDMTIDDKTNGWTPLRSWWDFEHTVLNKEQGIILTNAHVADSIINSYFAVSEDREVMWFIYPGAPSVRYTKSSDNYGTPAALLAMEQEPVLSVDVDTALLVTSPLHGYEDNAAVLGDSSAAQEGIRVAACGSPGLTHKLLTEGTLSNKDYSLMDSLFANYFAGRQPTNAHLRRLRNTSMWYDAPASGGGSSGSGLWALEGPEAGKVIGLHNMGMVTRLYSDMTVVEESDLGGLFWADGEKTALVADTLDGDDGREWLRDRLKADPRKARYYLDKDMFVERYPTFEEAFEEARGGYVMAPGQNLAVPINKVKAFLQERGIDPAVFGWEGVPREYWEN